MSATKSPRWKVPVNMGCHCHIDERFLFEIINIGQIDILSLEAFWLSGRCRCFKKAASEEKLLSLVTSQGRLLLSRGSKACAGLGALSQETAPCLKQAVGRQHNQPKVQLVFDLLRHMFCLYD